SFTYDSAAYAYFDRIRSTPGSALFDFPFCVAGGNGVGYLQRLCPYIKRDAGDYALREFHGKKVVGQFMGILHPLQSAPFERAGFADVFLPNVNAVEGTRMRRCLRESELDFLTKFFEYGDFAGAQLHLDLLAPDCERAIYRRWGNPIATTTLPVAGR